jgi:nucleoside-diphosphate-sugar epimerase
MGEGSRLHLVVGCNGPLGVEVMERLTARGERVRGLCRSGRAAAPPGAEVLAVDAADREAMVRAAAGAEVIHACVGVDYPRWRELWPPIVEGLLAAAAASGAALLFGDNLYAYGPQNWPLREDLPGTTLGVKPALRARLTERMLAAHARGEARVALVRASDFYGPRVRQSWLGERVFARLLAGRPASLVGGADQPHAFTYLPDFATAMLAVADAPDALGGIWHVPNAPALTLREAVTRIAALAGTEPRVQVLPWPLLRLLGLVVPVFRELAEMKFQWDRPYLVDHAKFAARFGELATPLDEGLAATVSWYREEARRSAT